MNAQLPILIVEDDEQLATQIQHFLKSWGLQAYLPRDFSQIDELVRQIPFSMILMDVNLPHYNGFYWTQKIRSFSDIPILFISSRTDDSDAILAITHGGDDYIQKPFHLELLKAKITALLRRSYEYRVLTQIDLGNQLVWYPETGTLTWKSEPVSLTRTEQKILSKLILERGKPVTREELMMLLWQTDEFINDGTLSTCISRLRAKLKVRIQQELIVTRKGVGYLIP